ncbi:sodium/hydrogen exchanger 3 [Oesophagostomum dentatum]|uniref:Sodium/hydrogen exchanger 3 n=1 Tax=Oesophagostomum dentatum TaxID=61180 RepID=A0A0B1TSY5_OESDE|nr:sodium/hydrogen exchanger 3 [Oesophagostomum dentatum]
MHKFSFGLFHRSNVLAKIFPESALLIVLGLIVGLILDELWVLDIYLHPDLFFLYLLPPIALDAGYFLPNNAFFLNFGTILLYAVVGTIFNIITIAGIIYAFLPLYQWSLPFIDILLFSTLISAVDPVAVLSVFEEIHVNQLLYICVFGESLLNDAVTIIIIFDQHVPKTYIEIFFQQNAKMPFLHTCFYTKDTALNAVRMIQMVLRRAYPAAPGLPLFPVSVVPYFGKCAHVRNSRVGYFSIAVCCEAIIFVFLGLSTFSKHHTWDLMFAIVTVMACIFCRFIGVIILTWLANRKRVQKIGLMDQVIMGYGGLRGAICYGLVMTLDKDAIPAKDMLVSTTVVVIVVTVFFQGTTIKPLVRLLKVKTQEPQRKTVTQQVLTHVSNQSGLSRMEKLVRVIVYIIWSK